MRKSNWKKHSVRLLNGGDPFIELDSEFQIVTESWNRCVAMPALTYMPDRDRLLMTVNVDYGPGLKPVHYAYTTTSDDRGATWSEPRPLRVDAEGNADPSLDCIFAATYLGNGRVFVWSSGYTFISGDYGDTWNEPIKTPESFMAYFTMHVDWDPATGNAARILNPTQLDRPANRLDRCETAQSAIWFSYDGALTWDPPLVIPEWYSYCEPQITRAANGDLVAALRGGEAVNPAIDWQRMANDNYSGLGVSISTDNGFSWSKVNQLYEWGRHHASVVTMPDGNIIMTYVVRTGYPDTVDGFRQWGIEAIVSKDNGRTWDMDHRFVLASWQGVVKAPNAWYNNCQNTSSVLLPDGFILTVFGTGYRAELDLSRTERLCGLPTPRDVGAVLWKPDMTGANTADSITQASADSDARLKLNNGIIPATWDFAAEPGRRNISSSGAGAVVSSSECYDPPEYFLYNPWTQYCSMLETIPAWVEIKWPSEHLIDRIVVHPGAPEMALNKRETTECVPIAYRLQYMKGGEWIDLIEPVAAAPRYFDFPDFKYRMAYHHQNRFFIYQHDFAPVKTDRIRILINTSSDTGIRKYSGGRVVVPSEKRKTVIRRIDVFEPVK